MLCARVLRWKSHFNLLLWHYFVKNWSISKCMMDFVCHMTFFLSWMNHSSKFPWMYLQSSNNSSWYNLTIMGPLDGCILSWMVVRDREAYMHSFSQDNLVNLKHKCTLFLKTAWWSWFMISIYLHCILFYWPFLIGIKRTRLKNIRFPF